MNLPVPPAPDQYDREKMQQIVNAIKELQQKVFIPQDGIAVNDFADGSAKLIRSNAGVVESVDAT